VGGEEEMTKEDFKKHKNTILREDMDVLATRVVDIENKLKPLDALLQKIDELSSVKDLVAKHTSDILTGIVKETQEYNKTLLESLIDIRLDKMDDLKQKMEVAYKQIKELINIKKDIREPIVFDKRFSHITAQLGVIVNAPLPVIQKVLDDLEMIYGCQMVYNLVATHPYTVRVEKYDTSKKEAGKSQTRSGG